jgi:hypothetical protein
MPDSSTWKREYLCEFVVDATHAVLPEFGGVEDRVCVPHERPPFFVPVIVMDHGFHDEAFALFGYYDFKKGLDVIERELSVTKTLAADLDAECSRIAIGLWGLKLARSARRHVDAPPAIVGELNANLTLEAAVAAERAGKPLPVVHHGWTGIAKKETDGFFFEAAANDVRTRLAAPSIRILPECTKLPAHCRFAVWKENRTGRDMERMKGFGHFDGVAALCYFARCLDRRTDPYPASAPKSLDVFCPWPEPENAQIAQLKRLARRR